MIILNPCDCGGLPFITEKEDKYGLLYLIRCQQCPNISSLEYNESESITNWNENNNSFKIDNDYLTEKLLLHESRIKSHYTLENIPQWEDH